MRALQSSLHRGVGVPGAGQSINSQRFAEEHAAFLRKGECAMRANTSRRHVYIVADTESY